AVGTIVEKNIKEEVAQALFISIEVDETTDISCTAQCFTVLRYVLDSDIKEVFIGFDILKDRTVGGVKERVFNDLDKYDCCEKLVAQNYDGAIVMASNLNGVQVKVREKASAAFFTHCYAHKLNLVLSRQNSYLNVQAFSRPVRYLPHFIITLQNETQRLGDLVRKRIPKAAPTRCSSNSKLIQTILQYHGDLCKLFDSMNNNPSLWDPDTLVRSNGFYEWLTKDSTYFFLIVYNEIFIKTGTLFNVLQTKMIDISFCIESINGTMNLLESAKVVFCFEKN
ncbi:uncharacterized protein LOC106867105, partial [Octopus bimaculoides]|uniref:uncharacterized protein LOC106867105 n=1 Tax=Octopus bimaculoides TaxID=37653 RepID=UPI00071C8D42